MTTTISKKYIAKYKDLSIVQLKEMVGEIRIHIIEKQKEEDAIRASKIIKTLNLGDKVETLINKKKVQGEIYGMTKERAIVLINNKKYPKVYKNIFPVKKQ